MKSSKIIAILGVVFSSAALADPMPLPQADSGLVSAYSGQVARLNIVNVDVPENSCSFTMSIIDSTGLPLAAPKVITNLVGGTSEILIADVGAEMQLRAHIDFTSQLVANAGLPDPMEGCYRLIPTLEVTDTTGQRALNPIFYGMPSWKKGEKIEKVAVCHKPNTPAQKTLLIPTSALGGHLGHSDTLGACPL
jgi:hypothetical protein